MQNETHRQHTIASTSRHTTNRSCSTSYITLEKAMLFLKTIHVSTRGTKVNPVSSCRTHTKGINSKIKLGYYD